MNPNPLPALLGQVASICTRLRRVSRCESCNDEVFRQGILASHAISRAASV
jgi:hypothetical protein